MKSKKKLFRIAFMWGRNEHFFESLTNYLLFPTVLLVWINHFYNRWKIADAIILYLVTISFGVHMLARYCHKREKKYHKAARK